MIISDLIKKQAKENPEKTAYIFKDEVLSFQDVENKIARCAAGLANLGVKKGTTFGLLLRNSPEFVILVMALSRLGAVAVPINFLEKAERIALILNDANAVGLLSAKEFYRSASAAAEKVPTLKHLLLKDGAYKTGKAFADLLQSEPYADVSPASEEDLLMLLYTSGTTGNPKGVMLSHGNFIANMNQSIEATSLNSSDRVICLLPMFHSFAWTTCVLVPLGLGIPCVINESLLPFDPVIKAIWKHKVTVFVAVPQIYAALTAKIKGMKALVLRFFNPARIAISGAAPLPSHIHQQFEKTFGIPLLEGYGLTETSPVVSLNPTNKRKTGTVGLPLSKIEIQLCDDDGKQVPKGEVGEIWIKGPNVMKGYYGREKETAEVLTPDGWLKSGDMGKIDSDGYLAIVDRKKDLIIVKGLNVYPLEVENVISQHPGIKEVAVVGKVDPENGEEVIRAFVTMEEGAGFDKSAILALCREKLAPYKRPKDVIRLDEMPKNALQKILKKDLRKL